MIRALPAAELLAVWEAAASRPMLQRALMLLAAAVPDASPGDLARLPLGRRDRLLFALREQQFGRQLTGVAACPECGERVTMELTTGDLVLPETVADEFQTEHDGWEVRFRLPNSLDLAAVPPGAAARRAVLARCLVSAQRHGEPDAVDGLPEPVLAMVEARMAEADPQAQLNLRLACPSCLARWETEFDVASYLWVEVQSLAGRLLREVHQLARAYGWSEGDILALTPTRRAAYLALTTA